MNKTLQKRIKRLLPDGKPKYVRVYDHPEFGDRYTVVFSGNYNNLKSNRTNKHRRIHFYLGMSSHPYHPAFGICSHEESSRIIDRPTYGHLGKKIKFDDLPKDCKAIAIEWYKDIWDLEEGR